MGQPHRPLSPFWIYRFGWTMSLSGAHRITGMFLSIGSPLFVLWLIAIASGEGSYGTFVSMMRSPFGWVVYGGFIFCIVYHLCNGLRHMGWDMGKGIDTTTAKRTGAVVVVLSLVLTATVLFVTAGRLA